MVRTGYPVDTDNKESDDMSTVTKPQHYPHTANAGIYDARAFRIGGSNIVHTPARFPDGNKVIAKCGQYGWATERDGRIATWANSLPTCPRCSAR